MDRAEAIKILERERDYDVFVSDYRNRVHEALTLAIEALEREIEYGQMVVDFTKGETMKSDEWKYDTTCDAESATTTDCISRQQVLDELKEVPFILRYNYNMEQDKLVDTIEEQIRGCTKRMIESLPSVAPPKRVVAKIKVDTEELIERIKEEYQLKQKHGRLIDADKLLQELFTVDEEEWTTPEIRAILENAPTIITPTEPYKEGDME